MSDVVNLIGFDHLARTLREPEFISQPIIDLFDKWRFAVQRKTVSNFQRGPGGWIDTAHDRRTITSERDSGPFPQWARVGSNSKTFRFGEFGTGLLSEDPQSAKKRHYPPPAALDDWAIRHGFYSGSEAEARTDAAISPGSIGWIVSQIIGRRGGLKPRRYLRNALRSVEPSLDGWLVQMARAVELAADRAGR